MPNENDVGVIATRDVSPLIKYTSSQRADVRYAPTSAISALIGQTCNRTFVVEVG